MLLGRRAQKDRTRELIGIITKQESISVFVAVLICSGRIQSLSPGLDGLASGLRLKAMLGRKLIEASS